MKLEIELDDRSLQPVKRWADLMNLNLSQAVATLALYQAVCADAGYLPATTYVLPWGVTVTIDKTKERRESEAL